MSGKRDVQKIIDRKIRGRSTLMTKDDIARKNLDLHAEWMKYIFENPTVLDNIPKGADIVILPEDDKELYEENHRILEENKNSFSLSRTSLFS